MPKLPVYAAAPAVHLPGLVDCDGVTPAAGEQPHGDVPQAPHLHRLVGIRGRPAAQLPKLQGMRSHVRQPIWAALLGALPCPRPRTCILLVETSDSTTRRAAAQVRLFGSRSHRLPQPFVLPWLCRVNHSPSPRGLKTIASVAPHPRHALPLRVGLTDNNWCLRCDHCVHMLRRRPFLG